MIGLIIIVVLGLMIQIIQYEKYMYETGFESGAIAVFWVETNTALKNVDITYKRITNEDPDKAIYNAEYLGGSIFIKKRDAKQIEIPDFKQL